MSIKLFKRFNTKDEGVEIGFKSWKFPAGEVGVKLDGITDSDFSIFDIYIEWNCESQYFHDEFVQVLQIADVIKTNRPKSAIVLFVPYLPYSRQDRACNQGESFALKVFVNAVKSAGVNIILTVDQHSNLSFDGFIHSFDQSVFVSQIQDTFDWFVSPDKGAFEKTKKNAEYVCTSQIDAVRKGTRSILHIPSPFAMHKVRTPDGISYDSDTSKEDVLYGDVLITDDICDGGATFLMCAKAIREKHPRVRSISLYVSHGIFSKGVDSLFEVFDNIYTANLMTSDENTTKKFVKINNLYKGEKYAIR